MVAVVPAVMFVVGPLWCVRFHGFDWGDFDGACFLVSMNADGVFHTRGLLLDMVGPELSRDRPGCHGGPGGEHTSLSGQGRGRRVLLSSLCLSHQSQFVPRLGHQHLRYCRMVLLWDKPLWDIDAIERGMKERKEENRQKEIRN